MANRVHNFNAGPAALPLPVLEEMQAEFLDWQSTGMSVLEVSHRSKPFEAVVNEAAAGVKRLLGLGDDYTVLFLQGGASMQFAMIPMNLLPEGASADYVNTGTWSTKAIKEAQLMGKSVKVVASSEDRNFCYIPKNIAFNADAAYVHITSNNTIKGTQWADFPDTKGVPIVADMSSDILSRPFDTKPFGMIYAGAQKNLGPAGVTLVIIRKDLLERTPKTLPNMLRYTTYADNNSLYNTPPCFSIYAVGKVIKWLEKDVGGLAAIAAANRMKGDLLYGYMDSTDFYKATADKDSRSLMNVTFRLPSEDLEKRFVDEATKAGLVGLKGHRSVGGCRASIYNATGLAAINDLVAFMKDFAAKA
ncbi:MAG: 3-phosphoserine/phosphohydroxythreonine transaminase [Deltaproteobacteria bacterium]|nr:3-phosphoserine/phosphohydroxythreonine transaminase [Deltaproteobacteria bacterium]